MTHLEPTYLRYIYDSLIKGSIHPENAAELPEGLIGLYEEAIDERFSAVDRQKLLKRFAIWALLKKEVSTAFVAEVLGEPENEIQDFIASFSAWFNSPESGKYQLYHERLKVYLLQKLSEGEVRQLNDKLVVRLEQAIEEQKADEFERYGLEFILNHLVIDESTLFTERNAQNICDRLVQIVVEERFVERQIEISKGILWTRDSIFLICSFLGNSKITIPSVLFERLIDLHKQEEFRIIRLLYNLENNNYLFVYEIFKTAKKNNTIDFQLAVVFYCLFLEEIIDAKSISNKETILCEVISDFIKLLTESTLNVYDVLPRNMLISKVVQYNIFYEDCFKNIFLSGCFTIDYDFVIMDFKEVFYNLEINERNSQNYMSICDSLIDYLKLNDEYGYAIDIFELKIISLYNLGKKEEIVGCIELEKKGQYFELDELLEIEEKLKTLKVKAEIKLNRSPDINDYPYFESFTFYPWVTQVIMFLDENNVVKAKSLMNSVLFDFFEIDALFEFLWRLNRTKYLKFILVHSKQLDDNKWDSSWCQIIINPSAKSVESYFDDDSVLEIKKKDGEDFILELYQCIGLQCNKNQRELVIQKMVNKSFEFSTHIRAIAHSFISIMHFQNGNTIKAVEYISKTIQYYSENSKKSKTIEIKKFIVFNFTKRHEFERAFEYLRDLTEKDIAIQSKILMHEISRALSNSEIIEWVSRLIAITENRYLVDEIIVVLNALDKKKIAEKIITSIHNSESKFLARLKLAELNGVNSAFYSEITSTIKENYIHCLNKKVLSRLINLGLIDLVREIFEFDWSKKTKKTVLMELAKMSIISNYFLQLLLKFNDKQDYIQSLTQGYLDGIKYPKIDTSILVVMILLNKNAFEIGFNLQILYFINEYFHDRLELNYFKVLSDKYNLQWAIDIKNQLPN